MKTQIKKLPSRVHAVSANNDATVLLALDVTVVSDCVLWFDTVKQRIMGLKHVINDDPHHFVFERSDGDRGIYTFVPLTLPLYHQRIKERILIPQEFSDEEAMLCAFEKTRESAW